MRRGRLPHGPLRSIISMESLSYSVHVKGDGDTSYGGGSDYTENAKSASLYLFSPTEVSVTELVGVQVSGSLQGLCLPSATIEETDRVDHGQSRYEVETKTPIPSGASPIAYVLSLKTV